MALASLIQNIPNKWILLFAHSDWLLDANRMAQRKHFCDDADRQGTNQRTSKYKNTLLSIRYDMIQTDRHRVIIEISVMEMKALLFAPELTLHEMELTRIFETHVNFMECLNYNKVYFKFLCNCFDWYPSESFRLQSWLDNCRFFILYVSSSGHTLEHSVRGISTSWWRNPASETSEMGLSPRFSSPTLHYCTMLARLRSEYSWVLALLFDWIIIIWNSSSASTKICQKRHLFPQLHCM